MSDEIKNIQEWLINTNDALNQRKAFPNAFESKALNNISYLLTEIHNKEIKITAAEAKIKELEQQLQFETSYSEAYLKEVLEVRKELGNCKQTITEHIATIESMAAEIERLNRHIEDGRFHI